MNFIIRPAAAEEIRAAAEWFEDNTAYGPDFEQAVSQLMRNIKDRPELYPRHREFPSSRGIRIAHILRFRYTLIYRLLGDRIDVVAFHHTSRDPDYWKSRL